MRIRGQNTIFVNATSDLHSRCSAKDRPPHALVFFPRLRNLPTSLGRRFGSPLSANFSFPSLLGGNDLALTSHRRNRSPVTLIRVAQSEDMFLERVNLKSSLIQPPKVVSSVPQCQIR